MKNKNKVGPSGRITENQALWAIIAVMMGANAIWAWSIGVGVTLSPIVGSGVALASGVGFVYENLRPDRRIAVLAFTSAQLVAFTSAVAILSYLTATWGFPLVDRYLAAGDAAIGFDWLSSFTWIQKHPAINFVLVLSYASILPQIVVLLFVLSITARLDRMREFLWLFVLTLLITVPLSGLLPAESAWVYFGVTDHVDAYHLADFTALRTGHMPEINVTQTKGLVTFPSFHATLALILIYATRGIRVLFPLSLGLNVLMIASTPSAGGHYLIDILAGLAVMPLGIFILRPWQREPSERLTLGAVVVMPELEERG